MNPAMPRQPELTKSDEIQARRRRPPGPRSLSDKAVGTLVNLLAERGLSEAEIDRGLDYVQQMGAVTMRVAYELAISRVMYTDEELAAGDRFIAGLPQPPQA